MSAAQVRETMQAYVDALLARGDYGRFFAEDVEFEVVGTDLRARGPQATEDAIRFLHEVAFDARPEISNVLVDEHGAAAELTFVGTHTGEFSGIAATGRAVHLPYSVFYDVHDGRITALRAYMSVEQLVAELQASTPGEVTRPTPS